MDVRIARSRKDYLAALRLLYDCYLRHGYTEPHPARIRFRPHLAFRTSRTLVYADRDGQIAGTLSAVGDNPLGIPADTLFRAELDVLRSQRRRLIEATGFAIAPGAAPSPLRIFFELTRLLVQYCYWSWYDHIVIAVHPRQAAFYRNVLGFEQFTDCRPHPYVMGAPAVGLYLDLRRAHRRLSPELCRRYLTPRIDPRRFEVGPMSHHDAEYFAALARVDLNNPAVRWEPPQRIAA